MDTAGARELAKRIAEEEQRRAGTHVVFVSHTSGYELLSREGPVPDVGTEISLSEDGSGRHRVCKVGASPLPGDRRRCAFLEPLP